jgi:hypothetical protein
MDHLGRLARWGGARLSRRLARSIPFVGALVAVATLRSTIQRKGFVGGLADTGLNSVPFVGAAKNAVELVRQRDFFPDQPVRQARRPKTATRTRRPARSSA